MLDDQGEAQSIILSIVNRMDGFLYRCRNDKAYSMMYMVGDVRSLTGCPADDFVGERGRSYTALTHPADLDKVYAEVDAAIAQRRNWACGLPHPAPRWQ